MLSRHLKPLAGAGRLASPGLHLRDGTRWLAPDGLHARPRLTDRSVLHQAGNFAAMLLRRLAHGQPVRSSRLPVLLVKASAYLPNADEAERPAGKGRLHGLHLWSHLHAEPVARDFPSAR